MCPVPGGGGAPSRPTVLSQVNHSMRIVNEEVFGPVMLIIPFSTDDEAVALANSTEYALGSSVFSGNAQRAHAVARRVVAGMTTINDFGVGYLIQSLPFGGSKISGFGRFGGPEGLREFSRQKSVVTDRFPGVLTKVSTANLPHSIPSSPPPSSSRSCQHKSSLQLRFGDVVSPFVACRAGSRVHQVSHP